MPLVTVQRFIDNHGGINGLREFIRLVNTGVCLSEIARQFNMSTSQVCRYRKRMFRINYAPHGVVFHYLELYARDLERKADEHREALRLIQSEDTGT